MMLPPKSHSSTVHFYIWFHFLTLFSYEALVLRKKKTRRRTFKFFTDVRTFGEKKSLILNGIELAFYYVLIYVRAFNVTATLFGKRFENLWVQSYFVRLDRSTHMYEQVCKSFRLSSERLRRPVNVRMNISTVFTTYECH